MSEVDFLGAVHAQPENLEAAARAFGERRSELARPELRRGTIVLSGIGASAHALIPAVLALRAAGRRAFAVSSAELRDACAARLGDVYVLVSQSGASVETVAALEYLDGAPVLAVSASADSPLARAADVWIPLGPRPDTPVATLSYTATLQALGLLCDAILGCDSGWEAIPELAARVLSSCGAGAQALAAELAGVHALDAAGAGGAAASAGETALLAREALRLPAAGMETREYLHGPLEAVTEGFGCLVFGGERERELADALLGYGAVVALFTRERGRSGAGVHRFELPAAADLATPVLEILPVQLAVACAAPLRGLAIGALSRHQQDTKVAL